MKKWIFSATGLVLAAILGLTWWKTQRFSFPPGYFLAVDCRIFDFGGKLLRRYPQLNCHFLDDGRLLAQDVNHLRLLNADGSEAWSHRINPHHSLTLSQDGKKVLAIGSYVRPFEGAPTRMDSLHVYDLNGNVLHEWFLHSHLSELFQRLNLKRPKYWTAEWNRATPAHREMSHANSFYEIPPNAASSKLPAFHAGNYLVSLHGRFHVFLVLDSQLKKILWISKPNYDVHDVQMLPSGNVLFFQNQQALQSEGGGEFGGHSALREIQPMDESVVWSYEAKPKESLRARTRGSVQAFGDFRLFSHDEGGAQAHLVDRGGRILWSVQIERDQRADQDASFIGWVRALPLQSFLDHSRN